MSSSSPTPNIKLYFLQASRSIRTAWQLEELQLPYTVEFAPRENGIAPPEFKKSAGGLGKFPTLSDHGVNFSESGNICEYLCDKYDSSHTLLAPPGDPERYKALYWVHASEGMFLLHGLACLYTRWFQKEGDPEKTIEGLSGNVVRDMDFLEAELNKSPGRFLLGEELTAADVMMHFSARFILLRGLGTQGRSWPRVEKWLDECEGREAYKKAVEKTGHQL